MHTTPHLPACPDRLRITFLLGHAGLTGGVRVVAMHARLLADRGHEVLVVSLPRPGPTCRARLAAIVRQRCWLRRQPHGPSHLDDTGLPHRILDRWRPIRNADLPHADVIVATWWQTAEWAARLDPARGAHAYFIQHYETHPGQPADRVMRTWQLPMHKIVVSQWLADLARDRFGDADVSLVPNAVDPTLFDAPPRMRNDPPTVGLMYSSKPFKAVHIALDAFRIAARTIPALQLLAFGAEHPTPSLPLPPSARFHFQPPQSTLARLYASCDLWLCASRSEGFGLPVLEAMACRTPVVATPAGAAPELLAPGGGLLVPHDDPHAMAQAIIRVLTQPLYRWQSMADLAHRTAHAWTWPEASARFEQALRRAFLRAHSPRSQPRPAHAA